MRTYIFANVTGFDEGKNSTTLMKQTHTIAMQLISLLHLPSVFGPGIN